MEPTLSSGRPLTDFDWTVRTFIYQSFADSGRAPVLGAMAAAARGTEHQVRSSLQRLFEAHEIAPTANGKGVWMANPFSAVPTDYRVETRSMTCYANCAWDALGIASILDTDAWTRAHCAESGDEIEFGVQNGELSGEDGVIHLMTPLRHAWDDIGFT